MSRQRTAKSSSPPSSSFVQGETGASLCASPSPKISRTLASGEHRGLYSELGVDRINFIPYALHLLLVLFVKAHDMHFDEATLEHWLLHIPGLDPDAEDAPRVAIKVVHGEQKIICDTANKTMNIFIPSSSARVHSVQLMRATNGCATPAYLGSAIFHWFSSTWYSRIFS